MKKIISTIVIIGAFVININAQETDSGRELYGKTLNAGVGIGYLGYVGNTSPFGSLNFEFDVARNFTLAPFVGIYSYRSSYYWGNPNKPYGDPSYRNYTYRETIVPIGLKGTYYFDELFNAGSKWDFYAAASIGFVVRSVVWENGYNGNRTVAQNTSPLYLNGHIGAEYHLTQKAGLFLDLSTGVSIFGLAIHF